MYMSKEKWRLWELLVIGKTVWRWDVEQYSVRQWQVVLTAELGDYEDDVHTAGDISEFRFVEEQTEDMELAILDKFKHCKYVRHVVELPSTLLVM